MIQKSTLFLFFLIFSTLSYSQLSIQNGTTNYLINFDVSQSGVNEGVFNGSGLNIPPGSGQLNGSGWAVSGMSEGAHNFGQINTSGDFARGTSSGGVGTGGFYAFEVGNNNRAIGVQPTGSDWTPGAICLKIVNNRSATVNDIDISYTVYIRNDQSRSNSFNFFYSQDNVSYTAVSSLSVSSPASADSNPSWNPTNRNVSLTNLGLNPGDALYLKWSGADAGGSGSRDEFALDDISIIASGSSPNCTSPTAQATNLSFGTVTDNSIQASFSTNTADKYLIVQSSSSTLSANPVDATSYVVGSVIGNGEVVQYSSNSTFTSSGLSASTNYYYFIFAANDNCVGGPDYYLTNPLTGSATTTANSNGGYYDVVNGETCAELKTVLHNLIKGHVEYSYGNLWTIYQTTDNRINDAGTETIVWDMYSDNPTASENEFTFVAEQCGTYSTEGDCYNREHSFPKSWWGGSTSVAQYTDLFTVVPVDGWINGLRNNNPYGVVQVGAESRITDNGSKLGPSAFSIPGYGGNVFEPIDAYKGDLARNYFYMLTRYENEIAGWENNTVESDAVLDGMAYPGAEEWVINMLVDWHNSDPVSQKEIDRNDAVFSYQTNRNPFIDHPEYVAMIWQTCSGGDTESPTTPSNLTASNTTETTTDLSWNLSTDNVGVTAYRVYRNGVFAFTTTGSSALASGLMASTTYDFYITAIDAAGNESATSNTVSITTATPPGGPTVLHEGYFESGWDNWQDGGSDASRYSGTRSSEGNYSIRLRDNSGVRSSMTSETFDLSSFNSVEVVFSFYSNSFENNENFFLRYYNGSSWTTVANYIRGTDFNNNTYYTATVVLDDSNYNFPTNAQFRFQADASGNNDQVYMDAVIITGNPGGNSGMIELENQEILIQEDITFADAASLEIVKPELTSKLRVSSLEGIKVYPNPASDVVNINFAEYHNTIKSVEIFNALGQRVIYTEMIADPIKTFNVAAFKDGFYLIRIIDMDNKIKTHKLLLH